MSVAIIVDTFPRWSERFIARELNELKRRGIAFTIYCLRAGDPDCDRDPEFAALLQHRVVLPACFLPSAARNLGATPAAKERMKLVEAELGLTAFRQIGCADSLAKLIREHQHKIIYAHFANLPSTLGWSAAEALNLPLVLSVHARDVFVDPQLLFEKIHRAKRVFTCNEKALANLRIRNHSSPEKLVLMRHGIPLERFEFTPRRDRTEPGKNLRLLAAGRFVPKKGFGDLINALASPELAGANIELTLLGDGPERKILKKRIAQHGLSARVAMPGVVFDAKLKEHFNWADAFVMPSIDTHDGDSDGVPNVVLEAFACGLPVIGTSAGSLADVLNESTGFVARPGEALTGAIREVLLHTGKALEKSACARLVVETQFDIRANIEPLITALTV